MNVVMNVVQVASLEEFKAQELAALHGQRKLHVDAVSAINERLAVLKGERTPSHEGNGHDPSEPTPEPAQPPAPPPPPARPSAKKKRMARCHICRRDFEYKRRGPIPKKPECGRPDCRPVDAAHRRDRDRNERK